MIQCPICQVLNEDGALFCAECGQRFAPTSSAPQPPAQQQQPQQPPQFFPQQPSQSDTAPPDQDPSRPAKIKLRSPMLGSSDDDMDGYEKPQMNKLRGTGGPRPEGESQRSTGKKQHLRSPLLDGDDSDSYDDDEGSQSPPRGKSRGGSPDHDPQENTMQKKKRLRSPLLGDDDGDSNEDFTPEPGHPGAKRPLRSPLLGGSDDSAPPRGSSKKGSLRSPLLGGSDDDFDDEAEEPRSKKGGLRSPMLGGGGGGAEHHPGPRHRGGLHSPLLGDADDYPDDEDDEPRPPKRNQTGPGGKPKLRSALLGGGGGYDDDEDLDDDWDDEDDDNPDVLRSPLLAAKRKRRPKPPAPAAATAPGQGVFGNQDMPPGVQIHRPGGEPHQGQNVNPGAPSQQFPGQQQPYHPSQGQTGQIQQAPSAAFPGPSEPQPPWQGVGAPPLPGWPGESQPQPGQPWPPPGLPNPGMQTPGSVPPLPVESLPTSPPWQNQAEHPAVGVLRTAGASHEVPPIVDDNDEFQLDISEPTGFSVPAPAQTPVAEAPRLVPPQSPARSLSAPSKSDDDESDLDQIDQKPERRNRVERRRNDRRFSNLIDEKPGQKSFDDEDDYSVGRPTAPSGANAGLGKAMFALGALALGLKIWFVIRAAGMWNLAQMPEFVVEQAFSGLALVGLIVLALSSMKK
ncbi:MAG: hypothetical protein SGJ27_00260 [Candidatus Melainabacteria bacterium]|nr:hypothetical protein [Candidatus Melainabacteria bacterium]